MALLPRTDELYSCHVYRQIYHVIVQSAVCFVLMLYVRVELLQRLVLMVAMGCLFLCLQSDLQRDLTVGSVLRADAIRARGTPAETLAYGCYGVPVLVFTD